MKFTLLILFLVIGVVIYYHPGANYDYISYLPGIIEYYSGDIAPSRDVSWNREEISAEHASRHGTTTLPNIVLIIADDLGYNDLSGGVGALTPHMDSIREGGVSFTQAYAGHATCSPARASLMTGRFPTRFGFESLAVSPILSWTVSRPHPSVKRQPVFYYDKLSKMPKNMNIPSSEVMISDLLRDKGYQTAYVGKWHLGTSAGMKAEDRFQESVAFDGAAAMYAWPADQPNILNDRLEDPLDAFFFNNLFNFVQHNGTTRFHASEYMTDYLAKQAVSAIRTKLAPSSTKDHVVPPLFLTVAFNAPHTPLQAKREDYESPEFAHLSHKEKVYAAMIKSLDRGVGLINDAIRESGQEDNTLVIFTSDNGGANYVGIQHMNSPLRGWKATFFEGGFRVPFFMKWPKIFEAGSHYDRPVSHVDIFATVAAAGHVDLRDLRKGRIVDGVDLLPYVTASATVDSAEIASSCEAGSEAENGECKATAGSKAANKFAKDPHEYLFWRTGSYTAFRYGDWKLQATWLPDRVWLTDLNNDEAEKHNLAHGLLWSDFKAILDVSPYHAVCVQMTTALAQATQNCTLRDNAAIIDRLCAVGRRLQAVASEQVDPLWPALTEVPISVDYARAGVRTWDEEYVYWAV
jgi:arylsulfatase A-like enzyme